MLIKPKSFIVALASSVIIALVLVLTLTSYLFYIEFKNSEFRSAYKELLSQANAKYYSRYIQIAKLEAGIETSGTLKGRIVIEGRITNKGSRGISDLLIKVRFIDKDGAILFETSFKPQDPSLGYADGEQKQSGIMRFINQQRVFLRPGGSFVFKKVLRRIPKEIANTIHESTKSGLPANSWDGRIEYEISRLDY